MLEQLTKLVEGLATLWALIRELWNSLIPVIVSISELRNIVHVSTHDPLFAGKPVETGVPATAYSKMLPVQKKQEYQVRQMKMFSRPNLLVC